MKHDKITHGNLWKQMSLYRTDWMEIKFKSPSPTKHLGSLLFYNSISLSDDDGQHSLHLPLGLLKRDVQILVVLDHHLGDNKFLINTTIWKTWIIFKLAKGLI